jgi:ketosteroid isomerase-like protein
MADYDSPQSAEDAYYDAFDEHDIEKMMSVWAANDNIVCLLPMYPAIKGLPAIRQAFSQVLDPKGEFDVQVRHLHWIESADVAVHLVEEHINTSAASGQKVYATNIYQKNADGSWHMTMHQNSPVPMPPPSQVSE